MSTADADAPLEGFPVVVEVSVSWGEMDAFGHVNNAVYLRYFENARIVYLERIGLAAGTGVGPILASAQLRFRRPVTYPDRLRVGVRATEVGDDRFTLEYRLVSTAQGEVAAEGSSVVVSFDYGAKRKAPLPDAVRRAIADVRESG